MSGRDGADISEAGGARARRARADGVCGLGVNSLKGMTNLSQSGGTREESVAREDDTTARGDGCVLWQI